MDNQQEQLEKEKALAQKYLDIAGVIMLAIGRDGKVSLINQKGCEVLGRPKDEIIGKDWFDNFIPEKIREMMRLAFNRIMNGEVGLFGYFENPVLTKSGSERMIRWNNTVIKDNSGEIIRTLSSGEDITEVVQAEKERNKAQEESRKLNAELLKSNNRLKKLLLIDPHTGLYNYRYLQEVIEAEFQRAKRYAHTLSALMLDIDYFKSINDTYGRQFGDTVLKQVARQLKMAVRSYDTLIRYSGEEFVILSPRVNREQALIIGSRLLGALNLYNFGNKEHSIKLKISMAVASYPDDGLAKGADIINLADQILAKAKESGGNRIYSCLDIKKCASQKKRPRETRAEINLLKGKIEKLNKKANQSLIESILAFAKTIELKDHYTGTHVENTVRYATEIARKLELECEEVEMIKQAAMLHDLGKIGISDRILHKKGRLTRLEFQEIKKHPQIGADILRPIQFFHDLIPFILYHHERWDGKGYPNGLKAEEIPLGARIIAIADVYQALTSSRPYRKGYSRGKALKIIRQGSGTQFDPQIVEAFSQVLKAKRARQS